MSKPFWLAAITGTILTAVLINRWATNTTDAGILTNILVFALLGLAAIDVFLGGPRPPTLRNP